MSAPRNPDSDSDSAWMDDVRDPWAPADDGETDFFSDVLRDLVGELGDTLAAPVLAAISHGLSLVGLIFAPFAWFTWGGPFLLGCAIVGVAGFVLGAVVGTLSLVVLLLTRIQQENAAPWRTRMSDWALKIFAVSCGASLLSSLAGITALLFCWHRHF